MLKKRREGKGPGSREKDSVCVCVCVCVCLCVCEPPMDHTLDSPCLYTPVTLSSPQSLEASGSLQMDNPERAPVQAVPGLP